MFELSHRITFSAAHSLHSDALSEAENRALYGPCFNLHGHNYELEVTLRGPVDPRTGMVMDLNVLSRVIDELVFRDVDHRNLDSDVSWLDGCITTAENVVAAVWERLAGQLDGQLHRLRLYESAVNFVDYYGPDGGSR